jgi:hypothetical protein
MMVLQPKVARVRPVQIRLRRNRDTKSTPAGSQRLQIENARLRMRHRRVSERQQCLKSARTRSSFYSNRLQII